MRKKYSIGDLETILDIIPQQIVYRDLSGKHIYCNDAYANKFLQRSKENIYGKRYEDFKELQDKIDFIKQKDEEVIRKKASIEYEETIYNNEKCILEISKFPILDNDGSIKGILSVINNVSYRKELSKLRDGFFSNIKHEFRTPINMILASIQLLEQRCNNCSLDNCKNCFIKDIHRININTLRILKISNNFIDLTNIKSGNIYYNPQNYDIINVIESMCTDINNYKKFKNINIIFDTEVEERIVTFDKIKLERIMINLISNAIKFNVENGKIEVNIFLKDNFINISVKDSGIGIQKERLTTIFNEFENVEERLTKVCEGSGVGLALTKYLVEMHGGEILVNSEIGVGSEFIVRIPDKVNYNIKNNELLSKIHDNRLERIEIELSDIYE